jgi:hypothetical protein
VAVLPIDARNNDALPPSRSPQRLQSIGAAALDVSIGSTNLLMPPLSYIGIDSKHGLSAAQAGQAASGRRKYALQVRRSACRSFTVSVPRWGWLARARSQFRTGFRHPPSLAPATDAFGRSDEIFTMWENRCSAAPVYRSVSHRLSLTFEKHVDQPARKPEMSRTRELESASTTPRHGKKNRHGYC